ncbi:hypothetical protein TrLO_g1364 [Triparma laevis f. longispina]|uniref:Uncharacterized protein n=1 Tax=Triparma laevis f. longispina TaxID=1714387 RepID=A0A9W7FTP2_9STRA|nr:hypothetical protein TrLO_g1364 [Triparma laevis f. longispina]
MFSSTTPITTMTLASLCGLVLFVGYLSPGKLASKRIKHYHTTARSSAMVIHNGTVYLSGQVGKINQDSQALDGDITSQTQETLAKIDKLLAEAGIDKTKIISTNIWLKDIKSDFAPMNIVWNDWVAGCGSTKGVRACVESAMARPTILVEIQVVAAL